jgi:transposase
MIVVGMKIKNIDVNATLQKATALLKKEKNVSPGLAAMFELLILIISLLANRLGLNSQNSSKPPSSDPNRKKQSKRNTSGKKAGGQKGRKGTQLQPTDSPDNIEILKIDKRTLPRDNYTEVGYVKRQVIDIETKIVITEYQAQIVKNSRGKEFMAEFPLGVTRPIQYGASTKASSVYMSQFQLVPYNRIEDYFSDQVGLNISTGSLFNFNKEAYDLLERFEQIAKHKLINSSRVNADETGINVNGKRIWLHTACNNMWTHFYPHQKRGSDAMNEIGILPKFMGVLCHDHWKPYYLYNCLHSLCNAHHLRELEWAATEDKQKWAGKMKAFLKRLNKKVDAAGGILTKRQTSYYQNCYDEILDDASKECPAPIVKRKPGQRGRQKKSKSRNLLERLIDYKDDVLRFMSDSDVPFTNNQGENDLRMTKVQQKISGCFRSMNGAYIFCRVRSYLITCRKHGIAATDALKTLFKGKLPEFAQEK